MTAFLRPDKAGPDLQIDLNDKTGFEQATSGIPDGPLDILVHSPGGAPAATESIVALLRARFDPVRFFVPHTAKSAATMLCMSGDRIVLGRGAELGPIDPQMVLQQEGRVTYAPAQAALDQFDAAHKEIVADPRRVAVWMPILRQLGPSFLQECRNAIDLSKSLVTSWLESYMFRGDAARTEKSRRVADWLGDHNNFMTHARRVVIEQLLEVEPSLKLTPLQELGPETEQAVMETYWAVDATFDTTDATKIIEHRDGAAYIKNRRILLAPPPIPHRPKEPGEPRPSRGDRRREKFNRG